MNLGDRRYEDGSASLTMTTAHAAQWAGPSRKAEPVPRARRRHPVAGQSLVAETRSRRVYVRGIPDGECCHGETEAHVIRGAVCPGPEGVS